MSFPEGKQRKDERKNKEKEISIVTHNKNQLPMCNRLHFFWEADKIYALTLKIKFFGKLE